MKKLSVKSIVEFRNKSDKSKKTFASALKIDKVKVDTEGGGNYWVSCLSAISSSYKLDDLQSVIDRRDELEKRYRETTYKRTKAMYRRNIDILNHYKDFDFQKWKPSKKIQFLKKHKDDSILTIKGLQVKATPNHVFSFKKNEADEIGAIWFIAKLNGFKRDELGMFADILQRYLKVHFSRDYTLNHRYCIAVDVYNQIEVNYSQLEKEEIPLILNSTLEEIKKLM